MVGEDLNNGVDDCMDISGRLHCGVNNPPNEFASNHAINLSLFGGAANFNKWMDVNVSPSCPPRTRSKVKNLIGEFASGMTNILGKLVQGWTGLSKGESDEVGRHFRNVAAVGASMSIGASGRFEYNSSQETGDTQKNLFDGDFDSGHGEDHDETAEAGADIDVDVDKPSEEDGGGQDGTEVGFDGQATGIDKVGEMHEAKVIGGAGGNGGGVAALSKRGMEGVGDGVDVVVKRARVDPVAARRRQYKKTAGWKKCPPKATMIKIKSRPASSMEVAAVAPAPKSNAATVNTAIASSSATSVSFLSSPADMLSTNEDIQDAPRDDLISPRTKEFVPTIFSLITGVSGVLDGSIVGDKVQPNADVMEKHSDQIDPTIATTPEFASSCHIQSDAHIVDLHATKGIVSSEAHVRDSTNISDTVVVDSMVRTVAPATTDIGVLHKLSPPKKVPARSAEKEDGSMFIRVSSLFPATASSNTVEPVQSKEIRDVVEQQCVAPHASKLPISPKPRTMTPNMIGVSHAAAREQLSRSKFVEEVIEVPDNNPPELVKVATLDLAKSYLQKQGTPRERRPMEFTPPSCSLGIEKAIDATPVSSAHPLLEEPMLAQPIMQVSKVVKFAKPIVQAYTKMEQDALKNQSIRKQVDSSLNLSTQSSADVVKSATRGFVRQARVVHRPESVDYEPTIKATKEQHHLYELLKRYADARSNNRATKKIRETRIIKSRGNHVLLGELADALKPTGKMIVPLTFTAIEYLNNHGGLPKGKIIMSHSVTRKIMAGDFQNREIKNCFAHKGEFNLSVKELIMFPLFQELAPDNPIDKAGHFYTICINNEKQRIEVLDSMRLESSESLQSHVGEFICKLKECWCIHYKDSKAKIENYHVKYIETKKQEGIHECGFYMLEYFAKWQGHIVPTITKESIAELRKVLAWDWITNTNFNELQTSKQFLEDSVKGTLNKYKRKI
ncbi:hypothetical protein CFC21_082996 [Triticum aestivum]|uniref:Ubiquitin-like protease family profile domain-containing protein n=2 Tax=Triticum aestivum TaxID=4565 RepID=A0A9R1I706_WHEAT|nr:hypothetical protein CFC21_082996 [Triticum aestivum]